MLLQVLLSRPAWQVYQHCSGDLLGLSSLRCAQHADVLELAYRWRRAVLVARRHDEEREGSDAASVDSNLSAKAFICISASRCLPFFWQQQLRHPAAVYSSLHLWSSERFEWDDCPPALRAGFQALRRHRSRRP